MTNWLSKYIDITEQEKKPDWLSKYLSEEEKEPEPPVKIKLERSQPKTGTRFHPEILPQRSVDIVQPLVPQIVSMGGFREPYAPPDPMDIQVREMALAGQRGMQEDIESQADLPMWQKIVNGLSRIPAYQNFFISSLLQAPKETVVETGKWMIGGLQDITTLVAYANRHHDPFLKSREAELENAKNKIFQQFEDMPVEKAMQILAPLGLTKGLIGGIGKTVKSIKPKTVTEPIPELTELPQGPKVTSRQYGAKYDTKFGTEFDTRVSPKFEPTSEVYMGFMGLTPQTFGMIGGMLKGTLATGKSAGQVFTNIGKRMFFQAKNRVKTPEGKAIVNKINDCWGKAGYYVGRNYERIIQSGLMHLSEKEMAQASNLLNNRQILQSGVIPEGYSPKSFNTATSLARLFDDLAVEAQNMNIMVYGPDGSVRPFSARADYVPRILKRDIAEKVYADLERMAQMDEPALADFANKVIQQRKGASQETIQALEHIMATRKDLSLRQALSYLRGSMVNKMFRPFGNLEQSRTIELPASFYETNLQTIMLDYIKGFGKRQAEIEVFGQDPTLIMKELQKIPNLDEAEFVTNLIKGFTGSLEMERALNPLVNKVVRGAVNFSVLTEIGLGLATIPNLFQSMISTFPKFGTVQTLKGIASLFTVKGRADVRISGAIFRDAVNMISGQETLSGFLADGTLISLKLSGFETINKFNKALASSTAKYAIPKWHKQAQGDGLKANIARNQLRLAGIDYKQPLTEQMIYEGMFKYAEGLQLQKNILNDPYWFNDPHTRPLALFWRFGQRQMTMIKDELFKASIKLKGQDKFINPMPVVRLMIGGYLAGVVERELRERMKRVWGGKPRIEVHESKMHDIMDAFAAAGAWGTLSEAAKTDDPSAAGVFNAVTRYMQFRTQPVIVSKGIDLIEWAVGVSQDLINQQKYAIAMGEGAPVGKVVKRAVPNLLRAIGGGVVRAFSEKLKTPEQEKAFVKSYKSRVRQRFMTLMINGLMKNKDKDIESALKYYDEWYKAYPDDPLVDPNNIGNEIREEIRRRGLKYLLGE